MKIMWLTNKIFWIIWCVCLCYLIALLYIIDHRRGLAGGTLMLFSQIFLLATIALCSNKSNRPALLNLIIAVIINTLLFFGFTEVQGEGGRLHLMFSIILINGCQGVGVLLFSQIKRLKQD